MYATIVLGVITFVVWLVKTLLSWWLDMKLLPPGPTPVPLFGNKEPADVHPGLVAWYADLRKQYGDVFTVYHGTRPTVVVNGYDAITELLIENGNLVHSRPSKDQHILNFLHNYSGLVWNNNAYKLLRKISSQSLKSFIWAHNSDHVTGANYQMEQLLEQLGKVEQNKDFDLSTSLRDVVSHDILTMIFGLQNQEKFGDIIGLHNGLLSLIGNIEHMLRIPLLKYLPKFGATWENNIIHKDRLLSFLEQQLVEQRGETEDRLFDSFYDTFIRHQRSQSKMLSLTEMDCHATVMQLMLAGLDAVHGSLNWLFLFLSIHNDVQEKLFKEITTQIGCDSRPTAKHMNETPCCMAVIYETIRVSNVAFTSLPYTNEQRVTINGQAIPANASISVNLVSVNKDPEIFPEPDKFNPDRFLDKEGNLINKKQFCAFSIGRRACLGESFSKFGIYKVMVNVLQRYRLSKIDGEIYSTECAPGFLSSPHPYKLDFIPRFPNAYA